MAKRYRSKIELLVKLLSNAKEPNTRNAILSNLNKNYNNTYVKFFDHLLGNNLIKRRSTYIYDRYQMTESGNEAVEYYNEKLVGIDTSLLKMKMLRATKSTTNRSGILRCASTTHLELECGLTYLKEKNFISKTDEPPLYFGGGGKAGPTIEWLRITPDGEGILNCYEKISEMLVITPYER